MLKKLIKHEFRATGRTMLPIYIALVAVTLLAKVSFGVMDRDVNWFLELVSMLIIVAFFCGIFALGIGVLAVVMTSFQRGFLSDEGYLTMTLPASTHKLISAKLIVGIVWYFATTIVMMFSIFFVAFRSADWRDFFGGFGELFAEIFRVIGDGHIDYVAHGIGFLLEFLLITVLSLVLLSLLGYAALAIGYSFDKAKKIWTFLFAFGFYFGLQVLAIAATFVLDSFGLFDWFIAVDGPASLHAVALIVIAAEAVVSVAFYFLTHRFLTKKLNLE